MRKTLGTLQPGESGYIRSVGSDDPRIKRRLVDMGITPMTHILVHKIAPLGDPIEVHLRGYSLSLRKADAMCNGELFERDPSAALRFAQDDKRILKAASGCSDHVTQTLGFAFVDGKTPVLSYANNRKAKDWVGSYPMLLRDGKAAFETVPAGLGGKRARMALALSDTHFAFFYVREEDGCTLEDFAKAILGRGFPRVLEVMGQKKEKHRKQIIQHHISIRG